MNRKLSIVVQTRFTHLVKYLQYCFQDCEIVDCIESAIVAIVDFKHLETFPDRIRKVVICSGEEEIEIASKYNTIGFIQIPFTFEQAVYDFGAAICCDLMDLEAMPLKNSDLFSIDERSDKPVLTLKGNDTEWRFPVKKSDLPLINFLIGQDKLLLISEIKESLPSDYSSRSRNNLSKRIARLRGDGLPIVYKDKRGYRLDASLAKIS